MNCEAYQVDPEEIRRVTVLTPRLKKLMEEWENAEPQVYVDDTLLFTESWKETEGLPLDIRWAKAFAKRLLECPLLIRKGEIIVGSQTKFIRGNGTLTPMKPREILAMCKSGKFDRKTSDTASTKIDPEDLRKMTEDAEYWVSQVPPVNPLNAAVEYELGKDVFDLLFENGMVFEGRATKLSPDRGIFQNWGAFGGGETQVSKPVLANGLNHVIRLCREERERMLAEGDEGIRSTYQLLRKYYLLEACIISCEAIIRWANRHADLAEEMAAREPDPKEKTVLLKIADVCRHVPAEPPRDFWEAVQAIRFLHLAAWKESSDRPAVPVGRLDQLLYPYYRKDKEEGKITAQDAAELLGALWLKIRECENLVTIPREMRAAPGTLLPNVTLCGVDENGVDQTNEISWLTLEVMAQIKLSEPAVYVRYSPDMDPAFIRHALTCNIRFGGGNPAFLNDRLGTQRYLERGILPEDAANWNTGGCLGVHLDCSEHVAGMYNLNQPMIFELAMYNGYSRKIKKVIGPQTGDFREFTSFDQVKEAYFKQLSYFVPILRKYMFLYWGTEIMNSPMSGLRVAMQFEDCIPAGLASREGGCRYPEGRTSWIGDRGLVDIADSMAAIKKLVFDEKKITMAQLLEAMEHNWEGYEDIRQMCLNAPKYGNDDEYVDEIYDELSRRVPQILQAQIDPISRKKPLLFRGAAAGHITIGKYIGALPNGRLAGSPVNDAACSVMPGMDVNGPTAAINSATNGPYAAEYVGYTMNMKFSKKVLNTPEKIDKLGWLLKAFMKRDGWHIQFNIHSREELLDAQEHPENHKNLIVRVGGYSAYFIDLPPELQAEIVTRTMHEVV